MIFVVSPANECDRIRWHVLFMSPPVDDGTGWETSRRKHDEFCQMKMKRIVFYSRNDRRNVQTELTTVRKKGSSSRIDLSFSSSSHTPETTDWRETCNGILMRYVRRTVVFLDLSTFSSMSIHLDQIARKKTVFLFLVNKYWIWGEEKGECGDGRLLIDQAIMLEAETTIVHLPVLTNKIMWRGFGGMLNVMHCSSSIAVAWRHFKWERWKEIYKGKSKRNFFAELLYHRHHHSSGFMLEWILHVMTTSTNFERENDSFEICLLYTSPSPRD